VRERLNVDQDGAGTSYLSPSSSSPLCGLGTIVSGPEQKACSARHAEMTIDILLFMIAYHIVNALCCLSRHPTERRRRVHALLVMSWLLLPWLTLIIACRPQLRIKRTPLRVGGS